MQCLGLTGSTRTWYASDALGSVRQTLNDSGSVLGAQHFDPWGQPQRATIAPFGFTGELQQGASVYLRARWYNAGSGTFGSRDSFAGRMEQPYSLMPYQYAYSNPVLNRDPSGRDPWWNDDVDPRPCAVAGQHRDEAGRCVYYKEWIDASTLTSIVVGGPVAIPDLDAPLVYAPRLPRLPFPGFGAAQRRSDPFILTNPTTPDGLLVFTAPLPLAKDEVFGDCHAFDDLFPGYYTDDNALGKAQNSLADIPVLIRSLRQANTPADIENILSRGSVQFSIRMSNWQGHQEPVYELHGYSKPVEVRVHLNPDSTIRQFRIGIQFITPSMPTLPPKERGKFWLPHPNDEERIRQADKALVDQFGKPEQNPRFSPKPGSWDSEYLDPLGFGYVSENGRLIGLRSDAGHIDR